MKPRLNVNVFRFLGKFDLGYSRSPVCYAANNTVIGIFTAKNSDNGYIIPIQTVLKKFEGEKSNVMDPSEPIDSGLIIDQGNKYFHSGNFANPIEYYERIVNDANYFIALYNKGLSLDSLEKYNDAIACYDKAIDIDPNHVDAWNNKGVALGNQENYKDAIACYDKAIDIDEEYIKAWYNRAIYRNKMKYSAEEVLADLHKSIEIGGEDYKQSAKKDGAFKNLRNKKAFKILVKS